MIEELQELALDTFLFASSHNVRLDLAWIPRDQNSEADRFSKVVCCTEAVYAFSQDWSCTTIGSSHQQLLLVKY